MGSKQVKNRSRLRRDLFLTYFEPSFCLIWPLRLYFHPIVYYRLRKLLEPKAVVLVGMMGSGKTTLGSILSRRLGIPFIDMDTEIEKETSLSIPELFKEKGEPFFREKEKNAISTLLQTPHSCIIATGGGAFIDPQTIKLVNEKALSVWLDADLETLCKRVSHNLRKRPLLQSHSIKETLKKLTEKRFPFYSQAHVRVTEYGDSPKHILASRLSKSIYLYLKKSSTGEPS